MHGLFLWDVLADRLALGVHFLANRLVIWCHMISRLHIGSYRANRAPSTLQDLLSDTIKLLLLNSLSSRYNRLDNRMRTLNGMFPAIIWVVVLWLLDHHLTLSLRAIDGIENWVIRLLNYLTADDGSLATRLLDRFQLHTLRWRLMLHVDGIICSTAVAFKAEFILHSHSIKLLILVTILVLHEFPSFNVSLHLLHPTRFQFLVL